MVDITKIWGDLDQDENFVYKDENKTIADLITQMNKDGLDVVTIDTSGSVQRVKVRATPQTRPDTGQEKSGWYFFMTMVMETFFAIMVIGGQESLISLHQSNLMSLIQANR